jgi:CDP-diacylglycerol--glycerol-3-phosphate 3-phosphatidyltransferase/cardiolipin synthase
VVDAVPSAPSAWNLANVLTVLRIALVPFFAWALLADGGHTTTGRLIATALFAVAAATDRLDGWLARRSGQVTDLGKLLDPIADKVLIGTALVLLSWLGDLPWWVTVVILVRELGITAMRFFLLRYVVLPASRGGKVKTVLQSVAIGLYLLPWDALPDVVSVVAKILMGAALVVTVVTGLDYARTGLRIRRTASRPPAAGL